MSEDPSPAGVLRNAPLVEALLELRFAPMESVLGYGYVPRAIHERLASTYPNYEELPAAQLPISVSPPPIRHRFSTDDGTRLFQVGNGVISVNDLSYDHYAAFRERADAVISEAIPLFGRAKEMRLRYINKINTSGHALRDVLRVGIDFDVSSGDLLSQQASLAFRIDQSSQISVSWAFPIDERDDLLLLDLVVYSSAGEPSNDKILSWMDMSHASIEQSFLNSLQPTFLETLR